MSVEMIWRAKLFFALAVLAALLGGFCFGVALMTLLRLALA